MVGHALLPRMGKFTTQARKLPARNFFRKVPLPFANTVLKGIFAFLFRNTLGVFGSDGLVVQLVRMPPCHGGGRGFESRPDRSVSTQPLRRRPMGLSYDQLSPASKKLNTCFSLPPSPKAKIIKLDMPLPALLPPFAALCNCMTHFLLAFGIIRVTFR
jgi:hypothetical protein